MPDDHSAAPIDRLALTREAQAAARAGDAEKSFAAWSRLRAADPQNPGAVVGATQALMTLGRLDEAEALAQAATEDAATAPAASAALGRLAERRRDYQAALDHWRRVTEAAPGSAEGWLGASNALCKLERYADAEAMLGEALRYQPDSFALLAGMCRVAEAAKNWDEAQRRWAWLQGEAPDRPEPGAGVARAMLAQHRHAEAEAAAAAVMQRFPGHSEAYVIHARGAVLRMDWQEAARRWSEVERRFPAQPVAALMRKHCEDRARLVSGDLAAQAEADAAAATAAPAPQITGDWTLDRTDAAQVKHFLMQFEALGRDCEFGLLQRRFGAEPLSLLRWSNMTPSTLIPALAERFEGVGTAEQTELLLLRDEYHAHDLRFDFGIHLAIKKAEADPERVHKAQCRRLTFLRDKLVADLDAHEKIFVYSDFSISDADIEGIVECLGQYGPNMLLCVRAADAGHPAGTTEVVSDRLVIGYTGQAALERGSDGWNIPVEHWLGFCEAAWRHRLSMQHDAEAELEGADGPVPDAAATSDGPAAPDATPAQQAVSMEDSVEEAAPVDAAPALPPPAFDRPPRHATVIMEDSLAYASAFDGPPTWLVTPADEPVAMEEAADHSVNDGPERPRSLWGRLFRRRSSGSGPS